MLIYLIVSGVIFLSFGIGLYFSHKSIYSVVVRYDDVCTGMASCTVTFTPTEDISDAMLYYRVDGFYGNHKNYVKSKSTSQLRGNTYSGSTCSPITTNSDVGSPTSIVTGATLPSSDTAYPCGLIAKYMFSDTFSVRESSGTAVALDETDIALSIDKDSRYKNTDNKAQQWLDFTNQHLMNWQRVQTFPWFDKLYAKVQTKLKAGTQYVVTVQNNYSYSKFDIKKSVVVSSAGGLGENISLPIIFMAMGGLVLGVLLPALCILEVLKIKGLLPAFKNKVKVEVQRPK